MRYVAFLRAINVGGHTVRMEALRREFESLGATNVETFIASGNVIFDTARRNAAALERAIEEHLQHGARISGRDVPADDPGARRGGRAHPVPGV